MTKPHHLNRRQALVYGATLLPINTFFKLYLRDQERAERERQPPKGTTTAAKQPEKEGTSHN